MQTLKGVSVLFMSVNLISITVLDHKTPFMWYEVCGDR